MKSRERRPILAAAGALALTTALGGCGLLPRPHQKMATTLLNRMR